MQKSTIIAFLQGNKLVEIGTLASEYAELSTITKTICMCVRFLFLCLISLPTSKSSVILIFGYTPLKHFP